MAVRVHVVDPSAFTPPYNHALCHALGASGASVELYTCRSTHGTAAAADGYVRREAFYGLSRRVGRSAPRRLVKLAEHVPDMLRYRASARSADAVHFQWVTVQHIDGHLLPSRRTAAGARRPLVLTAHDVLPREPLPGQLAAQRRLYGRFDAVVVHSAHGRERLIGELGVDDARVHVIHHGVLRPWEGQGEQPLPPDLHDGDGPVVLFFGLLRPYKGLDTLIEAWRGVAADASIDAQLWIVGMPRMDIAPLVAAAPPGVRFVPRFVSDGEILALMRRASFTVLPYHEIDQSGVVFTALGAGLPMLLSDVGGFPEIAATGAARVFQARDSDALQAGIEELLGDPAALAKMAACARRAADGEYSWTPIAERTLHLYEQLRGS